MGCVLLLLCFPSITQAESLPLSQHHGLPASSPNFRFPALSLSYVQYRKRRPFRQGVYHFTQVVGSRPFVLLYVLPGDPASETELQALDKAAVTWNNKLPCFGVVRVRNHSMLAYIKRRLRKLQIQIPILLDWRGVIAYAMLAKKLPSYTAINPQGNLRIAHASSLTEYVMPRHSLLQLLQQLAQGQQIPNVRAPGYSPNPYQLIGQRISFPPHNPPPVPQKQHATTRPHSQQPTASSHASPSPSSVTTKHPTLLLFWSIQCTHCQQIIPQVEKYYRQHKTGWSLQSVVWTPTHSDQQKLQAFTRQHALTMPILPISSVRVLQAFHIQSFPTFVMVDKTHTVQAVHLGAFPPPDQLLPWLLSPG